MSDTRIYDQGYRVKVLINWLTFYNWGIPSSSKSHLYQAVLNACTAWNNMAGIDIRFSKVEYTIHKQSVWDLAQGELLIMMDEAVTDLSGFLAAGGGTRPDGTVDRNRSCITFFRKNSDLTPWNWSFGFPERTEIDFQGVLIHEMGHACGLLDHSTLSGDVMYKYYQLASRFGPFDGDIQRLKNLYRPFKYNFLWTSKSLTLVDWKIKTGNLTGGIRGAPFTLDASQNHSIAVIDIVNTPSYLFIWCDNSFIQNSLWSDGANALFCGWRRGNSPPLRCLYGPSLAKKANGELMKVWIDQTHKINVDYSDTNGKYWLMRAAPQGARTAGQPGLCFTQADGVDTWILFWVDFSQLSEKLGLINYSLSTDDGNNWSLPTVLTNNHRVFGGVSAAAAGKDSIFIGFLSAPYTSAYYFNPNEVKVLKCRISVNTLQLIPSFNRSTQYTSDQTPSILCDNWGRLVVAWRSCYYGGWGAIQTKYYSFSSESWSNVKTLELTSAIPPFLASSITLSEVILWHAGEIIGDVETYGVE